VGPSSVSTSGLATLGIPSGVGASQSTGSIPARRGLHCLDCGDWLVVAFLFAFAATGAVYIFKNPSIAVFTAWTGTLTISGGIFHWVRVKDQKEPDRV